MSTKVDARPLVIATGDEGLQLNHGIRFAFAGSGYQLPYFDEALKILQKKLDQPLVLVSSQEDDWLAAELQSKNPNLYQETLSKFAKKHGLKYVGQMDYGDPRDLDDQLTRGHLVRPQKIHVADHIRFTTGGGEQTFNLRHFVVSADFLADLDYQKAQAIINAQIEFYQELIGKKLKFTQENSGSLGEKAAAKNQAVLDKILAAH